MKNVKDRINETSFIKESEFVVSHTGYSLEVKFDYRLTARQNSKELMEQLIWEIKNVTSITAGTTYYFDGDISNVVIHHGDGLAYVLYLSDEEARQMRDLETFEELLGIDFGDYFEAVDALLNTDNLSYLIKVFAKTLPPNDYAQVETYLNSKESPKTIPNNATELEVIRAFLLRLDGLSTKIKQPIMDLAFKFVSMVD